MSATNSHSAAEWPPIGSWWYELDHRGGTARKEVIAHDKKRGKVQLRGVVKTWAKVERFNGKTGGYERIK